METVERLMKENEELRAQVKKQLVLLRSAEYELYNVRVRMIAEDKYKGDAWTRLNALLHLIHVATVST
jgi:hypothetical protein